VPPSLPRALRMGQRLQRKGRPSLSARIGRDLWRPPFQWRWPEVVRASGRAEGEPDGFGGCA
jgi:hypothetical protein